MIWNKFKIDVMTKGRTKRVNRRNEWTNGRIKVLINLYETRSEFQRKQGGAYRIAMLRGIYDECSPPHRVGQVLRDKKRPRTGEKAAFEFSC